MKVGTVETIEERERRKKIRSSLSSGKGSNGGKRNRGGGGGGNNDDGNSRSNDFDEDLMPESKDKLRISMWFILLVVLMTFGGLIGTYIVLATNAHAEWQPFNLPSQLWISTILILASSATFHLSNHFLQKDKQSAAKNWLLVTTVLGGAFISSQLLAWFELIKRGVYVASNPYAGFFYIFTGVHALHVFVGIIVLGYILLRTWNQTTSVDELDKRKSISKVIGLYWHCMDALWIFLFVLLGFWK